MKRNLTRTQKTILSIVIVVVFIALIIYYGLIIYRSFAKEKFINDAIQISDANQRPVFKIKKLML